jgi:hypothetical protein
MLDVNSESEKANGFMPLPEKQKAIKRGVWFPVAWLLIFNVFTVEPAKAIFNNPSNTPTHMELLDSANSPDGKWVAERYFVIYPEDSDTRIALLPRLHSENLPVPVTWEELLPRIEYAYFKWLDNATLLIAAPEGNKLDTSLREYKGVHLLYGFYPNNPDTPRIAGSQKVVQKTVTFNYHTDGPTSFGADCALTMTAQGGEYIKHISLKIWATTPHGEQKLDRNYTYGILLTPEENGVYYTGMKVEDISGEKTIPRKDEIISLIDKIRMGHLHVKYGFWLDNTEVIYTNNIPKDQSAITAFKQCIGEHQISTTSKAE